MFTSEQLIVSTASEKQSGETEHECAFRQELQRLVDRDEARFADTDLHLSVWLSELQQSDTPTQAAHLYWALSRGFRILPKGHKRTPTASSNYFAAEHAELAAAEVARQLKNRFIRVTEPNEVIVDMQPLGAVPKGKKVRIIMNASKGTDYTDSVNQDIEQSYVSLPRLQEIIEKISRHAVLVKLDCSDYFLQLGLRREQQRFAAFQLNKVKYVYTRLPLGFRCSMRFAQQITVEMLKMWRKRFDACECNRKRNQPQTVGTTEQEELRPRKKLKRHYEDGYCDDWFAASSGTESQGVEIATAARYLRTGMELMTDTGMPFDISNPKKIMWPTQVGEILGVVFDTIKHEIRLSEEKASKLHDNIEEFTSKSTASLHEVEVLHGRLSWAACVLWGLRLLLFGLRRMLRTAGLVPAKESRHNGLLQDDTSGRARARHASILHTQMQMPEATKRDLKMIQIILKIRNSKSLSSPIKKLTLPFTLESDGSIYGGAAWFGGHCVWEIWPERLESADMAFSEAKSLKLGLEKWGASFANRHIVNYVDNEGLMWLMQGKKLSSPDPRLQNELVEIALILLAHNIALTTRWFDSESNAYADAGSRIGDPVKGQQYREKLLALTEEWKTTNKTWRMREESQNLSTEEVQNMQIGRQLLAEWRRTAAEGV